VTSAASYEISSGSHGLMSFVAYLKTSTSLPLNFGSHLLAAVLYQDIGDRLTSAFLLYSLKIPENGYDDVCMNNSIL